jgi:RimJ/RimL family protein N-acetyltransferase
MKIQPLRIESPRLFIRTYRISDAKNLFHLVDANKDLLSDYFPMTVENNTSVMAKRQYIIERNSERKSGKSLFAGIFLKGHEILIGQICAKDINWRVPKCEMGYFLDKNYFGKGFGLEASLLFSDYCFEKLNIEKITLKIEPKNIASKKLAEKCLFERIGISKNDFRSTDGRLMDCEIWEKIK